MRFLMRMRSLLGLTQGIKVHKALRTVKSKEGFLLVATLALLCVLTLLGTTAALLTRTETKISGNFRSTQAALQVAMAGVERAKQLLRQENTSSSDPASFTDELANST
ncbi:MAG TPA: hypothetical protein VHK27_10880, partial [Gammaproteobacteria bacterium]|nr:hypothetical protein [Gammaproteobacteria bacterium]